MVQHPMSWGRSLYLRGSPVPGHELVDAGLRPAVDESGQQVGEVDLWIDLIQLARLDQRGHACPVRPTLVTAREEAVFSRQNDRFHSALDTVRVFVSGSMRPSARNCSRPFQ